ncbi:MAG: ribosomal protein S18-alanine N-acetyltransferase [Terriglobales bacterium]
MCIRPATPADITAMRSIEAQAATTRWSEQAYHGIFSANPHRVALVFEDNDVEGFLVASQLGPDWELENIAVATNARRRGIGSALLTHFLTVFNTYGGVSVFLEVRESNAAARKLYEKHGFVEAGRRREYYQDPAEDAVLYRKTGIPQLQNPAGA